MRAWFLSDIHLKSLNERNGNILLRFLLSLQDQTRPATHLFLLGDIFDFWVGDHTHYEKKFQPLVTAILQLQKQGLKIVYLEGNHDVHVVQFWRRHGIECHVEDQYLELAGQVLRISHGDLINPNDTAYLRYREFVRRWYMEKLAHRLPAAQLERIGKVASLKSRKRSVGKREDRSEQMRKLIRSYAEKCYAEKPFDLLITGHMHVIDDWSWQPTGTQKTSRSINLGSWWQEPKVLQWDGQSLNWEKLE